MKRFPVWTVFLAFISIASVSFSQTSTFILIRHAEKDTSAAGSTMMTADPPLSQQGFARAQNLPDQLKAFTPTAIYSTNYTRTKTTVMPLATKFHLETRLYDPKKLEDFAKDLLQMKNATVVIAGHSNTTPQLANLLIGEKKYSNLPDDVYNQYWIVTVTDGKAEAKIITY